MCLLLELQQTASDVLTLLQTHDTPMDKLSCSFMVGPLRKCKQYGVQRAQSCAGARDTGGCWQTLVWRTKHVYFYADTLSLRPCCSTGLRETAALTAVLVLQTCPATVANSAMTRASSPALKANHPVVSCTPGGRLLQRALQRGKLAGHRIGLGRRRQAARLGRIALARIRQRSSLTPRACPQHTFWGSGV